MRSHQRYSACAVILLCVLSFIALKTQAQQTATDQEMKTGDAVANLVREARNRSKLPGLQRIEDPHLHDEACARANTRTTVWTTSSAVVVRNGAVTLSRLSYSTSEAARRTPELLSWATENERGEPRRFAVGVCFARSTEDPEGRYWIEVVTYMGGTKSFFYRTGLGLAHLWSR